MEPKNERADRLLKKHYPGLSQRQVGEALRGGLATHRGRLVKKGERIADLEFEDLKAHLQTLQKGLARNIPIVFDSPDYAVIDKPSGMHCHPLSLYDKDTITHWAFDKYPEVRTRFTELQPKLTPHRLDFDTSGLLVLCKNPESYRYWRGLFSGHAIEKEYLAWCFGSTHKTSFFFEGFLAHDKADPSRMVVVGNEPHRPPEIYSLSHFSVLKHLDDRMLVKVKSDTGVTHQIRLHLASLGFPIIGDDKYGSKLAPCKLQLRQSRLHCPKEGLDFHLPEVMNDPL